MTKQYLDMLNHVLSNGEQRKDRTGTGTISVFGYQNRYDLRKGFPLLQTKKLPFRWIAEELFWFLKGETNIRPLLDKGVHIWDDDAYRAFSHKRATIRDYVHIPNSMVNQEEFINLVATDKSYAKEYGDLGKIYGKQWRSWEGKNGKVVDQISNVIKSIKEDPYSRRHIVSAWNPADLDNMALPPCHTFFQFYVSTNGELSCQLYQRSADLFLGVPFNIASYALLTHMIADICGLKVGEFVHTLGDLHLYNDHTSQAMTQLNRTVKELPQLSIKRDFKRKEITDFDFEDFVLSGYNPDSAIRGKASVGTGK